MAGSADGSGPDLVVTPLQMIVVVVGTQGGAGVGGFNGGTPGLFEGGQGGGGASDIRVGGFTLADRVVVAGGGGGGASGPVVGMGGSGGFPDGDPGTAGDGIREGGSGATTTDGGGASGNAGAGRRGAGGGGGVGGGGGGGGYYGGGGGDGELITGALPAAAGGAPAIPVPRRRS